VFNDEEPSHFTRNRSKKKVRIVMPTTLTSNEDKEEIREKESFCDLVIQQNEKFWRSKSPLQNTYINNRINDDSLQIQVN
jgi:hypothetical protein